MEKEDWMAATTSRKVLTLVFLQKGSEILLGYKKRGFGQGLWNGFGGKVEAGETVLEAAAREVQEECGLSVGSLEVGGLIHFVYKGEPAVHQVHLFRTADFSGELGESEEMAPKWWSIQEKGGLPFHQMWPDDKIWFPLLLGGTTFRALFVFEGYGKFVAYKIMELNGDRVLEEWRGDEGEGMDLEEVWERVKFLPVGTVPAQDVTDV